MPGSSPETRQTPQSAEAQHAPERPVFTGETLYFDVATSTLQYRRPGEETQLLASFSDTHEHLYYFLRYLLLNSQYDHAGLAQIYAQVRAQAPIVDIRLRANQLPMTPRGLLQDMINFLNSDEARGLAQHLVITAVGTARQLQVTVRCDLPLFMPYQYSLIQERTSAYNNDQYGLTVGDHRATQVVSQGVIACIEALQSAADRSTSQTAAQLTQEQLLIEMSPYLSKQANGASRSLITVLNAYKVLLVDLLTRPLVQTTWKPGQKIDQNPDNLFWLNPHYVPQKRFQ